MRDIFFSFFFRLSHSAYEKDVLSLSLSLPQLGKHHRFGGAATTPPPKAPREGSVVEATIGGGGLVVTILLRPQIRCLGAP